MDTIRECMFVLNYWRVFLLSKLRDKEKNTLRRLEVKKCFLKYAHKNFNDEEIKAIYKYVLYDDVCPFPYEFKNKYKEMKIDIEFDKQLQMFYTDWHGKRMYLKRGMTKARAEEYVKSIYLEQDLQSPHRYFYNDNEIRGKVVADIGAAEGFFALDNVEKAKQIILFECDDAWYEALNMTFKQYADRVTIVKKYVSDIDDEINVRLDTYFAEKNVNFIKADIEGYEMSMIKGGMQTFSGIDGFLLCAYHKQNVEHEIRKAFDDKFDIKANEGYMFFLDDEEQKPPYIRRGVLHGVKK